MVRFLQLFFILFTTLFYYSINASGQVNNTVFSAKKRGLNYVSQTAKISTRVTPPGNGFPHTFNISGIPTNAVVEKAFIWWTASANSIDSNYSITKNNVTNNLQARLLGAGPDKCWQTTYTLNFRGDVTNIVNSNGSYVLNINLGSGPVDGIGVVVIYSDSTANYVGGLTMNDGIQVSTGNNISYNMNIAVPCLNTTRAEQLFLIGDIQFNASISNGINTKVISPNWFNFDTMATTLTSGINYKNFSINASSDCYSVVGFGIYYQYPLTTNLYSNLNVDYSCSNQTAILSYNSTRPLSITWHTSPVQYGDTAINIAPGKYYLSISDTCGNNYRDSVTVLNTSSSNNITYKAEADKVQVCVGDSVTVFLKSYFSIFDFNQNQLPQGWSITGGANFGSNICGVSPNNTPYYWSSTSGNTTPMIVTHDMNLCDTGTLSFMMRYAVQSGNSPCEGPDLANEGISIEYSTNGGANWNEFVYYSPNGTILNANPISNSNTVATGQTPFTVWNTFNVPIPAGAVSPTTRFRWIQKSSSGSCCDNWGLDDISIAAGTCFIPNVIWSNGLTNTKQFKFRAVKDTCFIASIYDNCNSLIARDTICIKVNKSTDSILTVSICDGQSYTFNGINYTTNNNTAKDTLINSMGCDSIVTLNLSVNPKTYGIQTVVICDRESYNFNGINYTTNNNTATDTLVNANGCDSIVTLNLTVNPRSFGTETVVICEGQSYNFNGFYYTSSNYTALDTFLNSNGCDSIVTLNLTVNPRSYSSLTVNICQGQSFTFNGTTYTSSNNTAKDTIVNALGCDSIVTLNLVVNPTYRDTVSRYVCSTDLPFVFNGFSYTTAGFHTQLYSSQFGCDSVVVLNMSVSAPTRDSLITAVACDSIVFENKTYYRTTNFTDTLRNQMGCDSFYKNVRLQVNYSHQFIINEEICADQSYAFHGNVYNNSGIYHAKYSNMMGCDSIYTLRLTVHPLPNVQIQHHHSERLCIGDTLILAAIGAKNYSWDGWIMAQHVDSAWVKLGTSSNTYLVTAIDSNGCSNATQMSIVAEDCCEIGIPNAFSPNNDGLNDVFKVVAPGYPKTYYLAIYNRYGQEVFKSHKVGIGWDGMFNNEPADLGTYHYILETECADGTQTKRVGTLHLVR